MSDDRAFVWIWLPGRTAPVVAGQVFRDGARLSFVYGRSYLARNDAIPLSLPELPLRAGVIEPVVGLDMAGALRDGAPDAWGQRVILNRMLGRQGRNADTAQLDQLTYLLESGSDRSGALDFQRTAADYVARGGARATLEELLASAEKVENGIPLSPDLDRAFNHGSSLGGARPKAFIDNDGRRLIAKFPAISDTRDVVRAEFVAMRLACDVGLDVAPVGLTAANGRPVLLVERFDRVPAAAGWARRAMVSALTLFELDESLARYSSYETLAEIVRHRFDRPRETLRELFGRLVFNILCGNTDDHARNHAAFWDGHVLSLTPAYDLCPQPRTGGEATQAMAIVDGRRDSRLILCVEAAAAFQLDADTARVIIDDQIAGVRARFDPVCDEAGISPTERTQLRNRQFLNPHIFQDYS